MTASLGARYYHPVVQELLWTLTAGCVPSRATCSITAAFVLGFPGNHHNDPEANGNFYSLTAIVYSAKCVVKIPDNFKCTLKCDSSAPVGQQGKLECRPKGLFGGVGLYLLGRKPECFDDSKDIPVSWPPNPFVSGGS